MSPIVTLSSDFGQQDAYVAEMKGVLLSRGPSDLRVVDLSHELPVFDVHAAALFVRSALPRFPPRTVHLVVVDPGVGSARQPLMVEVSDQLLVGPDNGVFGYLFDGRERVYVVDPAQLNASTVSSTFHGRDVFAPTAARLAQGAPLDALGHPAESYEHLVFPMVELVGDAVVGHVIHIDRFGNLITNITREVLCSLLSPQRVSHAHVFVAEHRIRGICDHYAQAQQSAPLALIGSSGLLEVAVRQGNAREKLDVSVGKQVRVQAAP